MPRKLFGKVRPFRAEKLFLTVASRLCRFVAAAPLNSDYQTGMPAAG